MSNKVTVDVSYEPDYGRYTLHFHQGKANWFVFLDDSVYNDPRMFSAWMRSIIAEVQTKNRVI